MRHSWRFLFVFIIALSGCQKSDQTTETLDKNLITASNLAVDDMGLSKEAAVIKTVHGNIVFKFFPKSAPNTVTRIMELIQTGFYDGLIFHRVVPNFVIQGGDPTGTGTSGSGKKLKAEFSSLKHKVGTVAMARSHHPDSADSQFYIALAQTSSLDGRYTVFGQVIEGIEILSKISLGDKMISVSIITNR